MAIDYNHPRRGRGSDAASGGSAHPGASGPGGTSPERAAAASYALLSSSQAASPDRVDPGRLLGAAEAWELCRIAVEKLNQPFHVDADGMYTVALEPVLLHVWARPWPHSPGGCAVIVAADVLSYVPPSAELGLGLLRQNYDMLFGAFQLRPADASGRHILGYDYTLLGDHLTLDDLDHAINLIGGTARQLAGEYSTKYGGRPPLYQPDFPVAGFTLMRVFTGMDPAPLMSRVFHALPLAFKPVGDYWENSGFGYSFSLGCFVGTGDRQGDVAVALSMRREGNSALRFGEDAAKLTDAWREMDLGPSSGGGKEELIEAVSSRKLEQLTPAAVGPLPLPAPAPTADAPEHDPKRSRRRR